MVRLKYLSNFWITREMPLINCEFNLISTCSKDCVITHSNVEGKFKITDVMIDGKNFFDQPKNSNLKTYDNIRKIYIGQGDDYTTCCLLDYSYFNNYCKMIPIDLIKQQIFDADLRVIQQINFTADLDRVGNTTMLFIIEEAKQNVLDFSQRTIKVL